LVLLLFAHLLD